MAIITQSIGSAGGRDFATIADWWTALPANLVTDGNSYIGKCYNDSEFVHSSEVILASKTTDASHTITLTTGPGQSFRDNVNVRSNALTYNPANGVAIRSTSGSVFRLANSNLSISNLQLKGDNAGSQTLRVRECVRIEYCIIYSATLNQPCLTAEEIPGTVANCVFISDNNGAFVSNFFDAGFAMHFCTCVSPSDLSLANGIGAATGSAMIMNNCAVFGQSDGLISGTGTVTATTCMTDAASPPSGWTGGKTYANQFINTTSSAMDFREKAGADLQGAGTADATNGATDISGLARPQGGAWDIGAWEFQGNRSLGCCLPTLGAGGFLRYGAMIWFGEKLMNNNPANRREFLRLDWK